MSAKIMALRVKYRVLLESWLLAVVGSLLLSYSVQAASSNWFKHEHGAVRLISGSQTVGTGKTIALGLQFRMQPGWKVYWRSPGSAGFPPKVSWAGSRNLANATLAWPVPQRFSVLEMETLGYKKEVVFPITGFLFEPGKPTYLRAHVRFLTCNDICIPYETNLSLFLPAGLEQTSRQARTIINWRRRLPVLGPGAPLSIDRAEISRVGKGMALLVHISAQTKLESPDVFAEGPPDYSFRKPEVKISSSGDEALVWIRVDASRTVDAPLTGKAVTLTAVDGTRAVEKSFILQPKTIDSGGTAAEETVMPYGLLAIIGLAILGGLILNLMPCVLPVLSIKLLTVVSHGGGATGRIRAGFVTSAAGILFCFVLLGTIAVALKSAGMAVGWGIQFQQPAFLVLMISVLTLFACNMWGLFEIQLPASVSDTATTGSDLRGLAGQFLTGVFATLLATPCTSPFLGTAVGFALSRGPFEIYAVFLGLGLGLAMPWLVVAAFPVFVKSLPKPGHWMITLKRVLSIALIGTVGWLLSVLWLQIGAGAAGMVALLVGVIVFSIWQYRHLGTKARLATWLVVGSVTAISTIFAGSLSDVGVRIAGIKEKTWQKFDLESVRKAVTQGETVLVDVTADWCLTCQVNKALVLNRGKVAEIFDAGEVIAMKADWTKPDPAITAYLKSFGRFGIPFNVVYGPRARQGIPLREILTESHVLAAIGQARGNAPSAEP
ncbi:MAG: protein-disulfide reductase DsbD domain-containing protein [Pseudomonadota bacterium]|nr:protein-disulfide reductase DsbD domain-containing protein [Pseudomonadota bacterium]